MEMHEDANGVMVPDSTILYQAQGSFREELNEIISELFGETGPLDPDIGINMEPIDDDEIIDALLVTSNL